MIHRRWFLVSIRVFIGLPLAAALAAIVALLVTGVTIDVSRWRDASAERVSTALGRTVTLEGPFELSLGRAAELRIGGRSSQTAACAGPSGTRCSRRARY